MTLAQAHVGSLIRIRAVVVDNFGSETTLYSQPTSLVQNVNSKPKGVIRILATGGS
jgi:ligand-binding sensor protein